MARAEGGREGIREEGEGQWKRLEVELEIGDGEFLEDMDGGKRENVRGKELV